MYLLCLATLNTCFHFSFAYYLVCYSDRTLTSHQTATISKDLKLLIIIIAKTSAICHHVGFDSSKKAKETIIQKSAGKRTMNDYVQNTLLLQRSHLFVPRIGDVFSGAWRYRRDQNMDFFTQFCFFSDLIRPHFSNHLPRRWNNSFHNVCAICYKNQKQYMAQMLLGLCLNQKEYI